MITTCGIPMCYLDGFEDSYMNLQYDNDRYFKKDRLCSDCVLDKYCRGLIGEYADLYGTRELFLPKDINPKMFNRIESNFNNYSKKDYKNYNRGEYRRT